MTCAEFQALSQRSPLSCTRAERAAHFCHMEACPTCRKSIQDAKAPPHLQPLVDELVSQAEEVFEKDQQDPEYVEQTFRAFLDRKENT